MKSKSRIALIGLVLVLTAGAFWYLRFFKRSPEYSLKQLGVAIKNHDRTTAEKYLDVNSIVDLFIERRLQSERKRGGHQQIEFGDISTMEIREEMVKDFWMAIEETTAQNKTSERFLRIIIHAVEKDVIKGVKAIDLNGKVASVKLNLYFEDLDGALSELELTMRQRESYWQIFDIPTLSSFLHSFKIIEANKEKEKAPDSL